jgi:nitrogen regulatory protein P-II 1/nitrogen regulatory protein P-II 2
MKILTAVIRPEQLPAVKQALFDSQIQHLTATTVMGTAPKSEQQMYRGVQREVSLFRRIEIKLAVNDSQVETAIEAISRGAHETGGWGRIMVQPLEETVTIWTGVRGSRAL